MTTERTRIAPPGTAYGGQLEARGGTACVESGSTRAEDGLGGCGAGSCCC
ncbi:hypothetical protein ES288_D06G137800v1 [Gossypium darwinii]|uniref:Uncharacterized protein n=1 Tax=Gossypium darwinii TaxID=34276 RepID=A0A5D2C801_GOSDA|nr:hypothetical protein ES288_D06G137800v1 [Gossypium darwinii]